MNKLLLLTTFLLSSNVLAQSAGGSKAVRINLGLVYSENRVYRGALIWDAPIMAIGPSFVFYDTVSLGAGGLSIFKRFGGNHTIALGASYFDDNEPNGPIIKLKESEEDFKNQRGSTFGSYLKYDFRLKQYLAFSTSYHKDLNRHKGDYAHAKLSTSIIPFLTFGMGIGNGDTKTNQYVYGPEAVSGVGHIDSFASLMLPFLPWNGRLMINYKHSKITQEENQNADFIRGNDSNKTLSLIATWSL